MGLKKGMTNNPSGRPKGIKSKKTLQWELLGDAIVSNHANRFNSILDTLEDKDFIQAYTQIINYFRPKLSSTQTDITTNGESFNKAPKEWL